MFIMNANDTELIIMNANHSFNVFDADKVQLFSLYMPDDSSRNRIL